jgi:beta-lactamase superfamily II metal-dependent hydrolase
LAAAAFVLLGWNTNDLFSTSFQLSFTVVGSMIAFAGPIFRQLRHWGGPDPFLPLSLLAGPRYWMHSAVGWLWLGASASSAAWLGSLPLMYWHFHIITPVALLANLLVVPLAFFILAVALLSILASAILPWLSIVFNNANWLLANVMLTIVRIGADVPLGYFYLEHPHLPERLVAKVTVLDEGAGAAVHVRSGNLNWLLDCGGERNYEHRLRQFLHCTGVNQVDGLLLSHGDTFHIGGAEKLWNDFRPVRLIDNPLPNRSSTHQRVRRMFAKAGIHPETFLLGSEISFLRIVTAKTLYPPGIVPGRNADDQSYVVKLGVASAASILFMFDSGPETERLLRESRQDLRSDILVKGQYVFGESGSPEFIDLVQPKLIIATSHGFPARERIKDEWAAMIQARGIKLFRQDETGAVTLRIGRAGWEARAYMTGEIFRSSRR